MPADDRPADPVLLGDQRPTIRVERRYPHAIEKVWQAVTAPEHLAVWFPSPVEVELRPGGAMRFAAFEGEAATGTVEEVDPPRHLSFTWGADRLSFDLAPDGAGTHLALTHSFDDRAGAPSFATGWEVCLGSLAHVLAGDPPPPPDRGVERHEQLVHELGLDRPEIIRSADGWSVRCEPQLTCPADVAWDLWFGTDQLTGEQRRAPAVGAALTPYMAPEVVIGTVTEVDEPHRMAFDVAPTGGPGDRVQVELGPGTGHGARLTLTVTGRDPDECDAAVEQWGQGAVGHLAAAAARWALADAGTVPGP